MKRYLILISLLALCSTAGAQSAYERGAKAIAEIDSLTLRLESIPPSQRGWMESFRIAYLQLYDLGDVQGAFESHIKGLQYTTQNGFVPIFEDDAFDRGLFRGELLNMSRSFFNVMCRFESEYELSCMLEEYFKDNDDDELYLFLRLHLPLINVNIYKDPVPIYNFNIQNDYHYRHWIDVQDKLVNTLRDKDSGLSLRLFSALKTQAYNYSVLRFIDKAEEAYDEAFRVADQLFVADSSLYWAYDILLHNFSTFYGSTGQFEKQIEGLDKERQLHVQMHGEMSWANRSVMLRLADVYRRVDPSISDSLRNQAHKIETALAAAENQRSLEQTTEEQESLSDEDQSQEDIEPDELIDDSQEQSVSDKYVAYLSELEKGTVSENEIESWMWATLFLLNDDDTEREFKRELIELHDKALGNKYNIDIPFRETYLTFLRQYPADTDSVFQANLLDKLVHSLFKNTGKTVGGSSDIGPLSVLEYIISNRDDLPSMDYQTRQYVFEMFAALKYSDISSSFRILTQDEREAKWGDTSKLFEFGVESAFEARDTQSAMTGHIMNVAILSKELLLNSAITLRKLILESGNEKIIETYARFEKLSREIMDDRAPSNDKLEQKLQLERELIEESGAFGDYLNFMRIQWQDILYSLDEGELAVEFVDFDYDGDRQYAAVVVGKNYRHPIMISMFSKNQLERTISSSQSIYRDDIYSNPDIGKLIWSNLSPYLEGVKSVYFSPVGELHRMAIEYMPLFDSEENIRQDLNLYRISSTRQLYNRLRKRERGDGAVLYGGISYDDREQETGIEDRNISPATRDLIHTLSRSGITLNDLPGSKEEVDNIEAILISDAISTQKYDSIYATTSSFKSLSDKRIKIIHVATHGFFFEDEKQKLELGLVDLLHTESTASFEDRSLVNNGLFFAGANRLFRQENGDGLGAILTAKDISLLDFRGLDLVVLSACQSALGEVNPEGVFGLQRGFKKAGAQTILMSLWPVDDRATQILMIEFYNALIVGKQSKREAFLSAQQNLKNWRQEESVEISEEDTSKSRVFNRKTKRMEYPLKSRNVLRTIRPYSSPRYWAAFIMLDGIK